MKNTKRFNLNSILMLLIIFTLSLVNVDMVYAKEDIEIKTKVGFESMYRVGYTVPFNLDITNNLRDIEGEVQIEFLSASRDRGTVAYAQPVSLPLNTSKNITMNIPIINHISNVKVSILEKGKTVFEKKVFIGTPISQEQLLVGIMSDNYDSVKYINSIEATKIGIVNGKTIGLNEKNFPEQLEVLNMFQVIVINDFFTSALNEAQYETLKQWILDGGNLLLGTGSAYRKTFSVFQDNFIKGSVGTVDEFTSNEIAKIGGETREFPMTIDVLDLFVEEGKVIISDNNKVLMFSLQKGKGTIGVAAFDFGLSPIADWPLKEVFARNVLGKIMPPDYYTNNEKFQELWSMKRAFSILPQVPSPKTDYLMILFVVYILLTGPISYIILKKKDKREYMWVTVPVLAILFSIIIYSMGFGTRIKKPVINVANYINIDEKGFSNMESYGSVISPNNEDFNIESEGNIILKPVMDNGYIENSTMTDVPIAVKVKLLGNKSSIEYYNSPMFDMKVFSMEGEESPNMDIKADLTIEGGKIKGTVTNNSKLDLSDVYIITETLYLSLEEIKAGESKTIDGVAGTYSGNMYNFVEIAYGNQYSAMRNADNNSEESRKLKEEIQNRNMFERSFTRSMDSIDGTKIIAFSTSKVTSDLLMNGEKYPKHEKTMIVKTVNLKEGKQ